MGRAYAIDVLRCLAILGMVLSAQIVWNPDLPAWMFHAQTPPPSFAFDPSVAGITWVDLVFPFFLFSMGAAFPLALRKKIESGERRIKLVTGIIKRWLLLAFFAIALANTRAGLLSAAVSNDYIKAVILIFTWVLFFCMFVRVPKFSAKTNKIINITGAALLVALLLTYKFAFGMEVSLYKSDIIILVLANMALFGTLIWWATKDNLLQRLGIVALMVALRIGAQVDGSWNEAVWAWSPVPWLYKMEFLKYLCIILPGSIAGDMVWRWMRGKEQHGEQRERNTLPAMVIISAIFVAVMWSMFTRNVTMGLAAVIILGAAAWAVMRKNSTETGKLHKELFAWGFFWLLLGFAFEAFEGGIKKDHATFSYFFITTGLAFHALTVISSLLNDYGVRMGALVKCGQNPMIAYTASGYVIIPLLTLTFLNVPLQWLADAGPWAGVLKGIVVTSLMMLFTIFFTNKKIFWRT